MEAVRRPNRIGHTIRHYAQVGSTNDLVRTAALANEPEGLVITTDEQTQGRGRRGRRWDAPPGSSLLLSVLLRPTWLPIDAVFAITMLAGVALCEAVEVVAPRLSAQLKWPNDLLLPHSPGPAAPIRKAAGILCELVAAEGRIVAVIVGIGTNVNWTPDAIIDDHDLRTSATSLAAAHGAPIEREALRDALLERLDQHYTALKRGEREALFRTWRSRLATLGQHITVTLATETITGYAEDVDYDGTLLLGTPSGATVRVRAGDVSA